MVRWLGILLRTFRSAVRTRRELALENLALRQQLAVWKARQPRPRLTEMDRIFWVFLSRLWTSWRHSLQVVRPETVIGWHRQGFRRYWAWKSRRRSGRPMIGTELRDLIWRMSYDNPLWGAPRIHGELLKLGVTVSQATVSKYMVRPRWPPSQAWRTFLKNHVKDLIALDFFTVPTAPFRVLFVLVMLTHSRSVIAAVYARKSNDQLGLTDEQKSVTRQVEHARAYAVRKGWTVLDECLFVDDAVSGAEFATRPGFVRLMSALKPYPPFQVLVMAEESRLGREQIEVAYALKQLAQAGVRVWLYLEDRERTLDSPTDKLLMSVTAFADELEREKARQRTYDALVRKARAGH